MPGTRLSKYGGEVAKGRERGHIGGRLGPEVSSQVKGCEQRVEAEVVVVGGGMAGVCAALAAARHGAKTALVQDRPALGGSSSSEIRVHVSGADHTGTRPNARESGILEELRLENQVRNPQRCASLWDLLLWEWAAREPCLRLYLNTYVHEVEAEGERIVAARGVQVTTERRFRFEGKFFIDCTGDGSLGAAAGADYRVGREGRAEFGETCAPELPDNYTLGSSLLFQTRDVGHPAPFEPPPWAYDFPEDSCFGPRRLPHKTSQGFWWVEWGGVLDTIGDDEAIRDELLKILFGLWDHIKNHGGHGAENLVLDWVGVLPGKRESRRLTGDHILTEHDLMQSRHFEDAAAYGGWPIDLHPPMGFYDKQPPCMFLKMEDLYSIPLRSLHSRNVGNLFFAGRNISASHAAMGSTRVMGTGAVMGQAVGTAAALCCQLGCLPRQLYPTHVKRLQQTLLKDDCFIPGCGNEDESDLARRAAATASSAEDGCGPEQVLSGVARSRGAASHMWRSVPGSLFPQWLQLGWAAPVVVDSIYLTFDTGLSRWLTLTQDDAHHNKMIAGPQPECLRDYRLIALTEAGEEALAEVRGNYQRRRVHRFPAKTMKALRLVVEATNGDPGARVFEVRAYREGQG